MSRHRTGREPGFEGGYLDSDPDLGAGYPSPHANIYARSGGSSSSSVVIILLCLAVLAALLGGVYYYAYEEGLAEGRRSLPPVVLADKTPTKKPAHLVPGGTPKTPENLNIYDVTKGTVKSGVPANADGSIESLIARSTNTGAQPPSVAKSQPVKKPASSMAMREDYMVQVAASRSRALARAAYSKMQGRYSDVLARRDPLIVRVDLRSKGIYYRVNVPGFSSRTAAKRFCADLKKRGQDCLVKKQP